MYIFVYVFLLPNKILFKPIRVYNVLPLSFHAAHKQNPILMVVEVDTCGDWVSVDIDGTISEREREREREWRRSRYKIYRY